MFQFPASPTIGQIFSPIPGVSYKFNGTGWEPFAQGLITRAEADALYQKYTITAEGGREIDVLAAVGNYPGGWTGMRLDAPAGKPGSFIDLLGAGTRMATWYVGPGVEMNISALAGPFNFGVGNPGNWKVRVDGELEGPHGVMQSKSQADALYIPLTQKATPNGVATLDANGVVPEAQSNAIAYAIALG